MNQPRLSRRSFLQASAAGASALALGGLASKGLVSAQRAEASTFIKGCDISWAQQMMAEGYTWKNASGTTEDLFTILAGYGIGAIRLRTWVDPSDRPGQRQLRHYRDHGDGRARQRRRNVGGHRLPLR